MGGLERPLIKALQTCNHGILISASSMRTRLNPQAPGRTLRTENPRSKKLQGCNNGGHRIWHWGGEQPGQGNPCSSAHRHLCWPKIETKGEETQGGKSHHYGVGFTCRNKPLKCPIPEFLLGKLWQHFLGSLADPVCLLAGALALSGPDTSALSPSPPDSWRPSKTSYTASPSLWNNSLWGTVIPSMKHINWVHTCTCLKHKTPKEIYLQVPLRDSFHPRNDFQIFFDSESWMCGGRQWAGSLEQDTDLPTEFKDLTDFSQANSFELKVDFRGQFETTFSFSFDEWPGSWASNPGCPHSKAYTLPALFHSIVLPYVFLQGSSWDI